MFEFNLAVAYGRGPDKICSTLCSYITCHSELITTISRFLKLENFYLQPLPLGSLRKIYFAYYCKKNK